MPRIRVFLRLRRFIRRGGRLLDEECECEEVDKECRGADVKARAHTERFREHAAEEGTDDAARSQCALHDAEA